MPNNLDIPHCIRLTLCMHNLLIGKSPNNMIKRIHLHNMSQKLITKPKTFRRPFNKPRNIDDPQNRTYTFFRVVHLAQLLEAGIRYGYECSVGVDCTERNVFSWHIQVGEQIKCTTFTDIGHA